MKTLLKASLLILLLSVASFARGRASGYCNQGGQTVTVIGYQSSAATPVQGSYTGSGCNVLVLYSNGGGTTATGPSGYVTTSGTTMTWSSGNVFNANGQWSGLTVTVNSISFTISSCASATVCTTTSSLGTNTAAVSYSMSSATPAAIFSDNAGTAKSNPFAVSATGYWFYYADNGSYANQYSGTAIQTAYTNAALPLSDPSNLPNVVRWNATLGTTFEQQCIAAQAAPNTAIVVDSVVPVATGFTASCPVIFYPGGSIQPASGQTVTLTGACPQIGSAQAFDYSLGGTVVLPSCKEVQPEWWGAKADGVTDNKNPLNYAAAAGGIVRLSKGNYYSSGLITSSKPSTQFLGAGNGDISCSTPSTCITFAAGTGGILIGTAGVSSSIRDMTILSGDTGANSDHGIWVRAGSVLVDNVTVVGFGGDGWHAATDNVDHGKVTHSLFYGNYGNGWYCNSGDCNVMDIEGNRAYDNGGIGFDQVAGTTNKFDTNDATSNTGGAYYIAGLSNLLLNNYCESSATMVLTGSYNNVITPDFGACTISQTATGQVYIGPGHVEIDQGVNIGGAGGPNSINLDPASASGAIGLNVNGKANAPVILYDGAGGAAQVTLSPNGPSLFPNGLGPVAVIGTFSASGINSQYIPPNRVFEASGSANNALVVNLVDAVTGAAIPLNATNSGITITVLLAHTIGTGTGNTIAVNNAAPCTIASPCRILSHFNNGALGTAYGATQQPLTISWNNDTVTFQDVSQ